MATLKRSRTWQSGTQTSKKKAKTRYATVGYVRQPRFILGKTQKGVLRYAEKITIAGAAVEGSLKTHVFSANGCYDPSVTGVGHQPRGFDQLMSLYDHYTVSSSRIKVRFTNEDASSRPFCAISVRDTNVALSDLVAVAEYGDKVIAGKPLALYNATPAAGSDISAILSTQTNIASFLGRTGVMTDPELKGSATQNPAEQVYFHVSISNAYSSAATNVDCFVIIEYDVTFHEPKQPVSS